MFTPNVTTSCSATVLLSKSMDRHDETLGRAYSVRGTATSLIGRQFRAIQAIKKILTFRATTHLVGPEQPFSVKNVSDVETSSLLGFERAKTCLLHAPRTNVGALLADANFSIGRTEQQWW